MSWKCEAGEALAQAPISTVAKSSVDGAIGVSVRLYLQNA